MADPNRRRPASECRCRRRVHRPPVEAVRDTGPSAIASRTFGPAAAQMWAVGSLAKPAMSAAPNVWSTVLVVSDARQSTVAARALWPAVFWRATALRARPPTAVAENARQRCWRRRTQTHDRRWLGRAARGNCSNRVGCLGERSGVGPASVHGPPMSSRSRPRSLQRTGRRLRAVRPRAPGPARRRWKAERRRCIRSTGRSTRPAHSSVKSQPTTFQPTTYQPTTSQPTTSQPSASAGFAALC
jgi:hypothetical protein